MTVADGNCACGTGATEAVSGTCSCTVVEALLDATTKDCACGAGASEVVSGTCSCTITT